MKYGRKIVRLAINKFPYEKINRNLLELKNELIKTIKSIQPNRDGIFGWNMKWKIKIHYKLLYIKISYFPSPSESKKGKILFIYYL